jgi:manganese/zinc/iron transport system permease protein
MGHAALPGVALAALAVAALGGDPRSVPPLLLGAAIAGAAGALAVQALARTGRVRDDAAIAVVLGSFYAAGVALLSLMQTMPGAAQAGLSRFILGQAAAMRAADAAWTGGLALACLAAALLLFRALRAVAFDADFARAQGLPVALLDLALLALILLVCVAGLQAVGLILVVALLVLPALTARLLAERLPALLATSAATGALAGASGAYASATLPGLPTGAAVVLAAALVFVAALLLSPRRG